MFFKLVGKSKVNPKIYYNFIIGTTIMIWSNCFSIHGSLAKSCNFYPEFEGVRIKTLDKKENFRLVSTQKQKVESNYFEDVMKAYSKAKLNARIDALRFIHSELVGDKFMYPEKVKDKKSFLRKFSSIKLFDMCYEVDKFVIVSVEISPSTIDTFE